MSWMFGSESSCDVSFSYLLWHLFPTPGQISDLKYETPVVSTQLTTVGPHVLKARSLSLFLIVLALN